MLNEARSILACAARCLDEVSEPQDLDAERCGAKDVVVVLRLGIKRLDAAHLTLDMGTSPDAGP